MSIADTDLRPAPRIHHSAAVDRTAHVGAGTTIWHEAQIAARAEIGHGCTLGKAAYVGAGARIGAGVKIGNFACLFGAVEIEDGVLISPHVVLTEDPAPRATRPDGTRQRHGDWTSKPVTIRRGATLGAGAVIAPGVTIGAHALVGIGAAVARNVPAHALMLGNPARHAGWVCLCATTLDDAHTCPSCARRYALTDGQLQAVTDVATRA